MSTFSVNFSAAMSNAGAAISPGFGVCLGADGNYVTATAVNLAASGRFSGIAITQATPVTSGFTIQYAGEIPVALTGLGAGTRSAVVLASDGSMVRSASPVYGTDTIVGDCDVLGNLTISAISRVSPPAGGGGSAPTGTGWQHWTSGSPDPAARAVNIASSDTTGVLPVTKGGTQLSALGTALQVLRTNAGATATEWGTVAGGPSVSGTGLAKVTSGSFNATATALVDADVDAAAAVAGTKISPNFGSQVIVSAGQLQIGPTPRSGNTAATIQIPTADPQTVIGGRNTGNTTDFDVIKISGGNVYFGNNNWSAAFLQTYSGANIGLLQGGSYALLTNPGYLSLLTPLAGWSAVNTPLSFYAKTLALADADYTMLAADYEKPAIRITGTFSATRVMTFPAGSATSAPFFIVTNSTGQTITCKAVGGGGSGANVGSGTSKLIVYNGTDYVLL